MSLGPIVLDERELSARCLMLEAACPVPGHLRLMGCYGSSCSVAPLPDVVCSLAVGLTTACTGLLWCAAEVYLDILRDSTYFIMRSALDTRLCLEVPPE